MFSTFVFGHLFSNVRSVLSQCNTQLRLRRLLYDVEVTWRKTIKHAFSMFYALIKHASAWKSVRESDASYLSCTFRQAKAGIENSKTTLSSKPTTEDSNKLRKVRAARAARLFSANHIIDLRRCR